LPFATVDDAVEFTDVEPMPFVLVTVTRSCLPTSPDAMAYVEPVAPLTFDHEHDTGFGHTCHWYVVPVTADPPSAHEPSTAVRVEPTVAVPETEVPPELVGAVGAARIVNERVTVAAVA
jgi:hypothetical protein